MDKNLFNNLTLSDAEIEKIINEFSEIIKKKSVINGKYNDDCEQEIRIAIHKTLSRNRKK